MNNVLEKGNIIAKIRKGEDLNQIIDYVKSEIYQNGPNSSMVLEIISYFKLFQPEFFKRDEQEIIATMGLFFKHPEIKSLTGSVFDMYHQQLKDEFGGDYTPMQADILKKIRDLQYFSFSAPTSTGKSFVFRHIITNCSNDVVVIVPSRALINEYYDQLNNLVDIKTVNVLTFVDRINTKHIRRNIFILTPERARDLFKNQDWLNIDLILFDEAQLSDEHSVRGLYFDSIVRRAQKSFPDAKFVFAHPFVENPEAQLQKNGVEIIDTTAAYNNYEFKNVGQIFYTHDATNQKFYHFGSDPTTFGKHKLEATFDPIEAALKKGGSVLIYVPKTHIYSKQIYVQFQKYISMCQPINDPIAIKMIDELKEYIGASITDKLFYNSDMLEKLRCGIVVHHGSMPLTARLILEHFTQKGYCKICFATSTLEQGINMPFDVVYLDRFEGSKTLSVKNLIGRAGRSTNKPIFDFGTVILRPNAMSRFRKVYRTKNVLSSKSQLDITDDNIDEKYESTKKQSKQENSLTSIILLIKTLRN